MSAPVQIGDILADKYRIERILGAGGMGVVVAATHLRLEQLVAIKFLLPSALESEDVVARFAREARAASRIQSEHVARVIDVGELDGGLPYMVMEYLEGTDLSGHLSDNGPLAIETAVDYLLQACEALAEAHAAGIVHRDLKPANLFLASRADGSSIVKVLDFGISKAASEAVTTAARLTGTAVIMGSPLYMSPEQLRSSRDVDARTDVWSLGIILFELVTGQPPFMGESVTEIIANIMTEEAPPLSSLRSDVPAGLQDVLSRTLARKRDQRFGSVAELSQELARFGTDSARASAEVVRRVLRAPVSLIGEPPGTLISRTRDTNEPVAVQARTAVRVEGAGGVSVAPPVRPLGGKAHPLGDTLLAGASPSGNEAEAAASDDRAAASDAGDPVRTETPGTSVAPAGAHRTTALAIGVVLVAALGAAGLSLSRSGSNTPAAGGALVPEPPSSAIAIVGAAAGGVSSAKTGSGSPAVGSADVPDSINPASASASSPTLTLASADAPAPTPPTTARTAAPIATGGTQPPPSTARATGPKTAAPPPTAPTPPATTAAPAPPPDPPAKGNPLDKLNKVQ